MKKTTQKTKITSKGAKILPIGKMRPSNDFFHLFIFEVTLKNRKSFVSFLEKHGFNRSFYIKQSRVWDRLCRGSQQVELLRSEIVEILKPGEQVIALPVRDEEFGAHASLVRYVAKQ